MNYKVCILDYLNLDFYIQSIKKMTRKKDIYDEPYTHQTSVIRRKYYINKRCITMGGSKNVKEPNEKKNKIILYQRFTKVQEMGSSKNEKVKKT